MNNETLKLAKASLLCAIAIVCCTVDGSAATSITHLFSFNGTNGYMPAKLVPGANGYLFGITSFGGPDFNPGPGQFDESGGVIFKFHPGDPAGTFTNTTVLSQATGFGGSTLIPGADGFFYGTTSTSVFRLNPDGSIANPELVPGGDYGGANPLALFHDQNGDLYGGSYGGNLFRINSGGAFTNVANFPGFARPLSLLKSADGNFYGTTDSGGDHGGILFKLTPDGNVTHLFTFHFTNGSTPYALLQGEDGDLYGATSGGGDFEKGTAFRITTNGSVVWQIHFNGNNGDFPFAMLQGSDGLFYGTTVTGGSPGSGTFHRLSAGGQLDVQYAFSDQNDGVVPTSLIQASDGHLYAVMQLGGTNGNAGTIVRINARMAPRFQQAALSNAQLNLTWSSAAGGSYQVEYTTNLAAGGWANWNSPITATNGLTSATLPIGPDAARFFRVGVLP